MNAEKAIMMLNSLFLKRKSVIGALEESMKSMKESESDESSILFNGNQKLLERLKKLASERVHPGDEGFEMRLLKGKSKKEKISYHETFIKRIDRISQDMKVHFDSLRDALGYQADIISLLRNLSHVINFRNSLDTNIIFKIGSLVHSLLSVSVLITTHEQPEAVLFLYNFSEMKKNLGDLEVCKTVNSETYKALRQLQGFDQTNILKSIRESLAFDVSLINLFNFVIESVYPEFLIMTRKDIRENHLERLIECYSNILKTGQPMIDQKQLVMESKEISLVELDMISPIDILASIYLLSPALLLITEENHLDKLTKVASHMVYLKLDNEKLPVHECFQELLVFFPNKKKLRRKSKAQQIVTFSQFLSKNLECDKGKENHVLNSFDSETVHSNVESFDSSNKEVNYENLSVKDFLVSIDLEAVKHSLSEARNGATLFVEECMMNFESLSYLLNGTINMLRSFPEVSAPLFPQIMSLVVSSRNILDNAEIFFDEIVEFDSIVKKKTGKLTHHVLKHTLAGKLKQVEDFDSFLKTRINNIQHSLNALKGTVKSGAELVAEYHVTTEEFPPSKLEERLIEKNMHGKSSGLESHTLEENYRTKVMNLFLHSITQIPVKQDIKKVNSNHALLQPLKNIDSIENFSNIIKETGVKLHEQIKCDRMKGIFDTVSTFRSKLAEDESVLLKLFELSLAQYLEFDDTEAVNQVVKLVGSSNVEVLKNHLKEGCGVTLLKLKKSPLFGKVEALSEEGMVEALHDFFKSVWNLSGYNNLLRKHFSVSCLTTDDIRVPIQLIKSLLTKKQMLCSKNILVFCKNMVSISESQTEVAQSEITKEVIKIINLFWGLKRKNSNDSSEEELALYTFIKKNISYGEDRELIPIHCI